MKVVNCRNKTPYDVYIGRGSKWGNPFVMRHEGERSQVIQKYREYILNRPELLIALPEIAGKTLGCWCKPKLCHGDILIELCREFGYI